ncbi:MAG: prepilin-type N-terminal cleavage/methylation domain-containing protein [Lachnospiraceae bacterium]|nr:prepilin-type N-terminal cleavage/methylation domain-containing protein [Lachnospiraceae bacterium]
MRKKFRIQKQNSGFSLVELIIAIAILVIVTGAVCSFIIITSRNYANGNNDISVQQEAQLALNQMSDVIIDATESINYVGYDESDQPVKALKDSEFAFTPEKKALIVYNTEPDHYMFYWQKSDESLYFSVADADGNFPMPGSASQDCVLLAENVTDFEVDLSQVEERRVVKLTLNFQTGTRKFEMANNITVRNKVVINNADIEPLDKRVRVNVSVKEPVVVLEPGETFHFSTPKVTGTNLLNKNVKWEIEGNKSPETKMLEPNRDGIIQIDTEERQSSFKVKVTTEAVDEDSKNPAEAIITVHVKRVTKVTLHKKSEELLNPNDNIPGKLEVVQGSTVTLGGTVTGVELGKKCNSCGEDPTGDKYLTDWKVVSGSDLLQGTIQEPDDSDHATAVIQIKADAKEGSTITIQATSYLSKSRPYGPVQGEITLKVVKKKNPVNPFDGILIHGAERRVDDIMYKGFERGVKAHVLAIHIVDNSTNKLVDYVVCKAYGWNIWVSPDYFDLDLKKSYTFYLQALECVSKEEHERYDKEHGTFRISSNEEIRAEYEANTDKTAPFAYTGTMFKSSEVFSTTLEPAQLIYGYNNRKYCATPITFDTANVLAKINAKTNDSSAGINVLDGLKFYHGETQNIDPNAFTVDDVKYSIYKGEGDDPAGWTPLYVYENGSYQGSQSWYEGNLQFGTASALPTINVHKNRLADVVGTYHIVPGIWFDPTLKIGNIPVEVISPAGYQFPVRTAQKEYVEFKENTFHVTVTAEGTMDIDTSDRFKGSVCFPLPAEMRNDSIFTNLTSTEWQEANIGDKDKGVSYNAIDANTARLTTIQFNRIRYRYIQSENAFEVEPIWETAKNGGLKLSYSYGIYKCSAGGSKWGCRQGAQETNNVTLEFEKDGATWSAHVPLPTDDDFMFIRKNLERQSKANYTIKGYKRDNYNESRELNCKILYCDYDVAKEQYKLIMARDEQVAGITKTIYFDGIYTWKPGDTKWYKEQQDGTLKESAVNIYITIGGQRYMTYIAEPSNDHFEFRWSEASWGYSKQLFETTDVNGGSPRGVNFTRAECKHNGDVYTLKLYINDQNNNEILVGTYTCSLTETIWTEVN